MTYFRNTMLQIVTVCIRILYCLLLANQENKEIYSLGGTINTECRNTWIDDTANNMSLFSSLTIYLQIHILLAQIDLLPVIIRDKNTHFAILIFRLSNKNPLQGNS